MGRIVKVTLGMSNTNDGTGVDWRYSDSVVVNSDGVVSLGGNPTQLILASWDTPDVCDVLKGKFACPVTTGSRFSTNEVVFFPNDTVFSKSSVSGGHVAINAEQYQIVTGYPAIPAGTTIEYLGVLGDFGGSSLGYIKYGSYVGTGTENVIIPFKNRPLIGFLNVDVTMFTDTNWIVPTGSSGISNYTGSATWSGGKLTLSKGDYSRFPNSSGKTYKYVAFLEGE